MAAAAAICVSRISVTYAKYAPSFSHLNELNLRPSLRLDGICEFFIMLSFDTPIEKLENTLNHNYNITRT